MFAKSDETKRKRIESMYQASIENFPGIPEVTAEELQAMLREEQIVIVDVRNPEEQAVSTLPGAITTEAFTQNMPQYEGSTVVAYCTMGHRSGLFVQKLGKLGWAAYNLKGAILAWTHGGGDLTDAEGPTRRVHVFGRKMNLVAEGYEGVW